MEPQKHGGKPTLMRGPAKREREAQKIQLDSKNYNFLDSESKQLHLHDEAVRNRKKHHCLQLCLKWQIYARGA